MKRILIALFLMLSIAGFCVADELTDAITGVDPRNRLTSGRGAALSNIYGPKEETEEAAPVEDLSEYPTLPSYGLSAKDLLDPMGTEEKDEEGSSQLPESSLNATSAEYGASSEETSPYPLY